MRTISELTNRLGYSVLIVEIKDTRLLNRSSLHLINPIKIRTKKLQEYTMKLKTEFDLKLAKLYPHSWDQVQSYFDNCNATLTWPIKTSSLANVVNTSIDGNQNATIRLISVVLAQFLNGEVTANFR